MFLIQHLSPILLLDKGHLQVVMWYWGSQELEIAMFTTISWHATPARGDPVYSHTNRSAAVCHGDARNHLLNISENLNS